MLDRFEDTKFEIMNTDSLLAPFLKANLAMETVFKSTKNHEVSINELWDQVNKLKEATGLHRNKDGINVSMDSETEPFNVQNLGDKDQKSGKIQNSDNNQKALDGGNTDVNANNELNQAEISQNHANTEMIQLLQDQIISQNKKIEGLEAKFNLMSTFNDDKFETYDNEINKLMKARFDAAENDLKTLSEKLDKTVENIKNKDYTREENLKNRFEEIEVSIRKIKRSMGPTSTQNQRSPSNNPPNLLQNKPDIDLISKDSQKTDTLENQK